MGAVCCLRDQESLIFQEFGGSSFLSKSLQTFHYHRQLQFLSQQQQIQLLEKLPKELKGSEKLRVYSVKQSKSIFLAVKDGFFAYIGQMKEGRIVGKGCLVLSDKRIFTGFFKDNKIFGEGSILIPIEGFNSGKNILIKGNWSDQVHGRIFKPDQNHSFRFTFNRKDWKDLKHCFYIIYPNYDEYLGEVSKGSAHGKGKYIYRNGDINKQYPYYEGMFNCGLREGQGLLVYNADKSLFIKWKAGKPDGFGYLTYMKDKYSVYYQNGKRIKNQSEISL